MIERIAVAGYRSLRALDTRLGRLTIVTGANGSGKSSFYRALRLMNEIAHGGVIRALALEGGLPSTLWAGPESIARSVKQGQHPIEGTRRKNPVALKLGFVAEEYGYAMELGLPAKEPFVVQFEPSKFQFDPEIKLETLWMGEAPGRSNVLAERRGPSVRLRDKEGVWQQIETGLAPYDSMMTHCADPREGLELMVVRERMRGWRFYDHLRTDAEAPARRPQIGTRTPALAGDGSDLAAALQTIREIGAREELAEAIDRAFPGHAIEIIANGTYFELEMQQPGLLRPLKAAELSEGTLKYLLLVAALYSPRPPGLMVLNEPETSLHTDLIPALARSIGEASARGQIVLVSHAQPLIDAITADFPATELRLTKAFGETVIAGDDEDDREPWVWPKR